MLTKTPAAVLLPTAGLLVLLEWFRRIRAGEGKSLGLLLAFVAWVALVAVTFVALWPAMWVAPLHVLSSIVSEMRKYSEGHDNPMFFLGRPTENPGPFFYPVAYLFRTTPAVLIGLVAAVALGWKRQWPLDAPVRRRSALGLVAFALLFAAVMTLSAKKFDRYLSPAYCGPGYRGRAGLAGPDTGGSGVVARAAVPHSTGWRRSPALSPEPAERFGCTVCDLPASRLVCLCPLPLLFYVLQPPGWRQPDRAWRTDGRLG